MSAPDGSRSRAEPSTLWGRRSRDSSGRMRVGEKGPGIEPRATAFRAGGGRGLNRRSCLALPGRESLQCRAIVVT